MVIRIYLHIKISLAGWIMVCESISQSILCFRAFVSFLGWDVQTGLEREREICAPTFFSFCIVGWWRMGVLCGRGVSVPLKEGPTLISSHLILSCFLSYTLVSGFISFMFHTITTRRNKQEWASSLKPRVLYRGTNISIFDLTEYQKFQQLYPYIHGYIHIQCHMCLCEIFLSSRSLLPDCVLTVWSIAPSLKPTYRIRSPSQPTSASISTPSNPLCR